MDNRDYILGEDKYVEWRVTSCRSGDTVVITGATYELVQDTTNEAVDTGSCVIDGTVIKALICPPDTGTYRLTVTVTVPPEIIKAAAYIRVR